MKEYINIASTEIELIKALTAARENYRDDENNEIIDYYYNNDSIEEYAHAYAESINREMERYLHEKSQRIPGNISNVVYDYCNERTGVYGYDFNIFNDMVKRLDDGMNDKQTKKDRDFLTNWYFSAFGTYWIKYNFQEMIGETIYQELEAQ